MFKQKNTHWKWRKFYYYFFEFNYLTTFVWDYMWPKQVLERNRIPDKVLTHIG